MGAGTEQEAARWNRRGYAEAGGSAGVVELVKFRAVSIPRLLFWVLQPVPTEAAPRTKGQPRAFRFETPPGKSAGAVQPVSAVPDVVVSAGNGRFPWTSGELPLSTVAGR